MRQAAANGPGHARSKYTVKEGQYNPVSATTEYGKDFLRIIFLLGLFLHFKGRRMLPRFLSYKKFFIL